MAKSRVLTGTLVLMLVLMTGALAQAQDVDPCLGLAQADCDLINSANANTATVESFMQSWSIDFSITGVPDAGDITFAATGSGPVAFDMSNPDLPISFQQDMEVSFSSPDGADSGPISATLVDGVFYIDNIDGQIVGINIMDAGDMGADVLGFDPNTLLEDPGAALGGADTDDLMGILGPAAELVNAPGFLSYVRDGSAFNFTADLGALLSAQEFMDFLEAAGEAAGDPTIAGLGMMAPMILEEGVITVQQRVDEGANLITGLTFTTDLTVDAGMLTGETDAAPLVIDLVFNVDISEPNGMFEIVAPEGAEIISPDELGMP